MTATDASPGQNDGVTQGKIDKPPSKYPNTIKGVACALGDLSINIGDPEDWSMSSMAKCHSYLRTGYMLPNGRNLNLNIECFLGETALRPQGSYTFRREIADHREFFFMPKEPQDCYVYTFNDPKIGFFGLHFDNGGRLIDKVFTEIPGVTTGQVEIDPLDIISGEHNGAPIANAMYKFVSPEFFRQLVQEGVNITQSFQNMLSIKEDPCSLVLNPPAAEAQPPAAV